MYDRTQRNVLAASVANIQTLYIKWLVAVLAINLRDHLVLVPVLDKICEAAAAECCLHSRNYILAGKPEVFYLHPVERNLHLGFIEFQVYICVRKSFILPHFVKKFWNDFFQLVDVLVLYYK